MAKDDKSLTKTDAKTDAGAQESFLTQPIAGSPVRVWHAILGALAAVGGVYLLRKKKK